ncbi:MAG: cytochrome b/b6 domain-containing protein, partial [Casimicrobiaceae bacterium]
VDQRLKFAPGYYATYGGQFENLREASQRLSVAVPVALTLIFVLLFFTFVRDNWPKAVDLKWIAAGGGLFNDKHIPSERFNAGEKVWFWGGVMLLGIIVGGSGLVLNFPNFGQTRATMQSANLIHLSGSILFMIGALGHIYMGTVGMAGAFQAMKTGLVDETWAKEHHELWYDDIKAGKIPAVRSAARSMATGQAQPMGGDD